MLTKRTSLTIALLIMASTARAGLFDDDEARKRILSIESEMRRKDNATDERLNRIENNIKNLGIIDILNQIEELKNENARLRGQLEVISNDIASVDKKQKDFYVDLDSRLKRLEQSGASAASQPSIATPSTASAIQPATDPKALATEKKAYEAAYGLFLKKDYAKAIPALQAFVDVYPASQFAPSAQYWLGLSLQNKKDYKQSLSAQQSLIKKYPDSNKVPDALLAIASIEMEQGNSASAKGRLEDLMSRYPNSEAATKARQRLGR